MEPGLVTRALRRKKWLLILAALGASTYGAYRLYSSPSVVRKRNRLIKLVRALISAAEMVSGSAETVSIVSNDLKEFLSSDSDEIPTSLKQVSKIATSDEFSASLQGFAEAATVGIYRGLEAPTRNGVASEKKRGSFSDKVMEKVLSKAGTGFVSVVVGSFARNLVMGFYDSSDRNLSCSDESSGSSSDRWVDVVCSDGSKEVIANCIQVFVSTAVAAYLEKTKDVNVCDDLFGGMTNPKHEDKVRELLVSVCNGAVETLVKTSHQVLTSSGSSNLGSWSVVGRDGAVSRARDECLEQEGCSMGPEEGIENSGWIGKVSSTLAVPRNRKFVLDVTGRVTLETVRTFLEFMMWILIEGLKRTVNAVHGEIVGRGLQVVRFFGAKSSAIVTICLALHFYVLGGTRVLLTA
ncbi:protein PHLOEM PROTEIN 2-LIKE A10-like [Argentina anserina]|uniref:protein PHLOEM PROTEIN 2-LIKE A10-like n=1 Tax=Argentina anserina TaxID=57926 RepID=UPI002176259E|nr:protein PHLOEM PROTEIN 2-LIKE A10-like [Potentilla anserina]